MLIKLLGFADILVALNFFLISYGINFRTVALITAIYLLIKGLLFIKNLVSVIDLLAGIILILGFFLSVYPKPLLLVAGFILLQKGIFSILA